MQRSRYSTRRTTVDCTLSSMSLATNSQKANNKRKASEEKQPDVVADVTENEKSKTNGVANNDASLLNPNSEEIASWRKFTLDPNIAEEEAPWKNFEPFPASKMSWMLQQLLCEAKENRRIMNQMQEQIQLQSSSEKGKNEGADEPMKPKTSTVKESVIPSVVVKDIIFSYPLATMTSLDELEAELKVNTRMVSRLNLLLLRLPHPDAYQFLFNILNFLLNREVAVQFSYYGIRPWRSFKSLFLHDVIQKTVKKKFPTTEDSFFTDRISAWLKACKKKHSQEMKQLNKSSS